jgi:hypothetical protein
VADETGDYDELSELARLADEARIPPDPEIARRWTSVVEGKIGDQPGVQLQGGPLDGLTWYPSNEDQVSQGEWSLAEPYGEGSYFFAAVEVEASGVPVARWWSLDDVMSVEADDDDLED